jgi:hypothetical protein
LRCAPSGLRECRSVRDGYAIANRQGKPKSAKMPKTRMNAGFLVVKRGFRARRVQKPFIAILKLPFKFDRSLSRQHAGQTGGWEDGK